MGYRSVSTAGVLVLVAAPLWATSASVLGGCDAGAESHPIAQRASAASQLEAADAAADSGDTDPGVDAAGGQPQPQSRTRAAQRKACEFAADAPAEQTLDRGSPVGDAIPIDHFVIIMQENRSFDHYFQGLPDYGQPDAHVAPSDFSNPKAADSSERVTIHHAKSYCQRDLEHGWSAVHAQYSGGSMQGFVEASHGNEGVMAYYTADDLPYYYALANTFAIADHYFSDVLGPTFPNRMYLMMGSSHGLTNNGAAPEPAESRSIFHRLAAAGVSFKIYADQMVMEEQMLTHLRSDLGQHFASMDDYRKDAEQGTLPAFSWIESSLRGSFDGVDEHPPSNVQLGQQFVANALNALMAGPSWPSSAAFLTYDEHGGFYDHVVPPSACTPDDEEPQLGQGATPGRFDHLGMRVPLIAISPFAKPHHVSHHVFSHSSLLRLLEARFGLTAISARTANAEALLDLFDFGQAHFSTPPGLPEASVDQKQLQRCRKIFPPEGSQVGGS